MTFIAARGFGASSFGAFEGVTRRGLPTCLGQLRKVSAILGLVVVSALDIALIALACYWNFVTFLSVVGRFPSYWWTTLIVACMALTLPVGVGTLLRGMLKEASPRLWSVPTLLWSSLLFLLLIALYCVLTLLLLLGFAVFGA